MATATKEEKTEIKTCSEKFLNGLEQISELAIKTAIKNNHRRMFVFCGSDKRVIDAAYKVFSKFIEIKGDVQIRMLYVAVDISSGREKELYMELKSRIEQNHKKVEVNGISFKNTDNVMGQTFDVLVLDLNRDLNPNDLGRLIETVSGGGIIIILAPPMDKWLVMKTRFHKKLITPPWTIDDVPGRFNKRFIRKLKEHQGIYIFDVDEEIALKVTKEQISSKSHMTISIPEEHMLPKEAYEMALTQGQVRALKVMERFLIKREKKPVIVMIADRGRGKSAIVGIAIAAIAHELKKSFPSGRVSILVTSPQIGNVRTLFEFAIRMLKRFGYSPKVKTRDYYIEEVTASGIRIFYESPWDAIERKADITAVDEAAGIPIPLLFRLLRKAKRIIYSSTIHGYEGAGRGFSIRFLGGLKEIKNIEINMVELEEPIRYSEDDPIEQWLYDALLLDAEPAQLLRKDIEQIKKMKVVFKKANLDEWFIDGNEEKLRQFVGIYVYAHYRNQPKDVALLADAPHHKAYMLETKNGKIVNAIQVALEGGLPDDVIKEIYSGFEPDGNIIPTLVEKHFRDVEFPKLKGYRIVRIATHPQVMSMGLGSEGLSRLCEEAKKEGLDWVGAGFGATPELLRFWIKNGFIPIHVSPRRNPISGEYSTIVIKPLSDKAKEITKFIFKEFKIKFVEWLRDLHYDMEPEIAMYILNSKLKGVEERFHELSLTESQRKRLEAYVKGALYYEVVCDVIREIVKMYFLDHTSDRVKLSEGKTLLLILKSLQARSWKQTLDVINLEPAAAYTMFRSAIKKLYKTYIGKIE